MLAALMIAALHFALTIRLLPDLDDEERRRIALLDAGIALVLVLFAVAYLGRLTHERRRHAIVDGLVDIFSAPASIEDAGRSAVAWLVGAETGGAALVAVVREDSGREALLTPLAAAGYRQDWQPEARVLEEPGGLTPRAAREAAEADPWVQPLGSSLGRRPWAARVPIMRGDEILGLLLVVGRHAGALRDKRLLTTVGALIASAFDHARLYEAEYAHALELEEQDARRREFLYAIAHELRSPLNSIHAFAELLNTSSSRAHGQQQLLASLTRGVGRLSGLVDDLLNLGRFEQGMTVSLAPVDVGEAMRNVEAILRPAFMEREQAWSIQVPEQPLIALADGRALEHVLLNLLSNANRYTPRRGAVSACANAADGHIRIEVQDSGPGIAPEDRTRIFEPFYRVHRPGAPEVPGSGLGLAIARRLVQLQDGRIWVEDSEEGGTRFCVDLPAVAPHKTVKTPTEAGM